MLAKAHEISPWKSASTINSAGSVRGVWGCISPSSPPHVLRDFGQIAIHFESRSAVLFSLTFMGFWGLIRRIDHKHQPLEDYGNFDGNFATNDSSCVCGAYPQCHVKMEG